MCPAFAVGRTQELLYYIRIIKDRGLVRNHEGFPVVVDSPLAAEATNIYSTEMYDYYDDEAIALLRSGINPVTFPDLKLSVSSDEVASSRISTGGFLSRARAIASL